jgi:hypothetical protein
MFKVHAMNRLIWCRRQEQFFVGDVTRLEQLGLPACGFALDMGCLHRLSPAAASRYATALSAQMLAGARYLLYAIDPRKEAGLSFGVSLARLQELYSPAA